MYFFVFVVVLLLALFAVFWNQCFWTNFVNCLMVILCSAIAYNIAPGLAARINEEAPEWSGYTEFIATWFLFWSFFTSLKKYTNYLSKFPVRLGKKVDHIFDICGCLALTLVMYSWISFTLFASPVGDPNFVDMMNRGVPSLAGRTYGYIVFEVPSKLGMANEPFSMVDYARTRMARARAEEDR
ncbi:hypothetical protein ACYFX5_13605 [Bremerella sp. T1]|uniref:hypothetical protein n=1 Tax=Bremerella sp. TYQ1 TaxID=3119568 RepID=UPI001CCDF578|nr:hypothetical protein [Bremerella volcania]UBM34095.1 hypothetical protein LA756_15545 [Bremerella volcania]